jgi:hypothetical protein
MIDCDYMMMITENVDGNISGMIDIILSCLEHSLLRTNDAVSLLEMIFVESKGDKVDIVQRILMQLYDSTEAIHFLHSIFQHNRNEILRLKWEYGMILRPLLGNPNGYYYLDLSHDFDRKCLLKLMKMNNFIKEKRKQWITSRYGTIRKEGISLLGDLSQNGNFSCFRNERFNHSPSSSSSSSSSPSGNNIVINDSFIASLPNSGILEFDFLSFDHCPFSMKDTHVKDDSVIVKTLIQHHLLSSTEKHIAETKLEFWKKVGKNSLTHLGFVVYENTKERAKAISDHMHDFYIHLEERHHDIMKARENMIKPPSTAMGTSDLFPRDSYPMPAALTLPPFSLLRSANPSWIKEGSKRPSSQHHSHNHLLSSEIPSISASHDDSKDYYDDFCLSVSRDEIMMEKITEDSNDSNNDNLEEDLHPGEPSAVNVQLPKVVLSYEDDGKELEGGKHVSIIEEEKSEEHDEWRTEYELTKKVFAFHFCQLLTDSLFHLLIGRRNFKEKQNCLLLGLILIM